MRRFSFGKEDTMATTERVCKKNGKEVYIYRIANKNGMRLKATNYGAAIMSLEIPDVHGMLQDVVLEMCIRDSVNAVGKITKAEGKG